jgi:hypothetical protein
MQHVDDIPPVVRYTESNLSLRFLDILTYPRPARKFSMLLGRNTLLAFVREIMMTEVGLTDVNSLELITRGKRIPKESDILSLQDLNVKNNQQIIISRVLGGPSVITPEDKETMERNRRFVGDLLFGPTPAALRGGSSSGGSGHGPLSLGTRGSAVSSNPYYSSPHAQTTSSNHQSIVRTFTISHSFQLVGRILERLIVKKFSEAIRREETAKASERELLALLDAESKEQVTDVGL